MNADTARREILKDELMLNEDISIFDSCVTGKTWDEEITENCHINDEFYHRQWIDLPI